MQKAQRIEVAVESSEMTLVQLAVHSVVNFSRSSFVPGSGFCRAGRRNTIGFPC